MNSRNYKSSRPICLKVLLAIVLIPTVCRDTQADDDHDHSRNQLPRKQHRDSDAPFLKPAEAVAKMAIPDGFEVSVFASEPDIAEPSLFALIIADGCGLRRISTTELDESTQMMR